MENTSAMSRTKINFHDNWEEISYESRYLDSLCSAFSFVKPCVAVKKFRGALILSYNSTLQRAHEQKTFELIKQIMLEQNNSPEILLKEYLIFNTDFNFSLSKMMRNNTLTDETKNLINELKTNIRALKNSLEENISRAHNYDSRIDLIIENNNLLDQYRTLIHNMNFNLEQKKLILRPLQDVCKLMYHISENNDHHINNGMHYVANDDGLHAEHNLFLNYTEEGEEAYYGTSKLACGHCHVVLSGFLSEEDLVNIVNHRGTHAKFYNTWLPEETRNQIEHLYEGEGHHSEHRRLSFDPFEKILTSQKC